MRVRLLDGWARKASIPVVVLAILGWLIFVVGFGLFNSESDAYDELNALLPDIYPDADHRADVDWFPHWCFIVTGPILFINIFVHLVVGRWFTGLPHNFLFVLYLASGGGAMYRDGGEIISESPAAMNRVYDLFARPLEDISRSEFRDENELGRFLFMGAIGAVISAFFMIVYMVLWAFFSDASRRQEMVIASGNQWEMMRK